MGNLFASLRTASEAMRVFERALSVVQNNVTNASTPGYAKQRLGLEAQPFQPALGLPGGVGAGDLQSYRSRYAEEAVQRQQQLFGRFSQKAAGLAEIEPLFAIGENSGIAAMMSRFFQSFSALAVSPNNTASRQVAIERAGDVAGSFNQAAALLGRASQAAQKQVSDTVDRINRLGSEIREINEERRWNAGARTDAGMDARLHVALEELAELVNFTALEQGDGSTTVLLDGQTPLVMSDRLLPLSADFSLPLTAIRNADGTDVTNQMRQGRLSGVLELHNTLVPAYLADLDRLAQGFADRVNTTLAGGVDLYGSPPTVDLFRYDDAAGAALTLAVTQILPADIAAAAPNGPGGNANALALAALANSREIDGFTFTQFYGNLAARAGRDLASAQESQQVQEQLLAASRSLRGEVSGVSLDEEAAHLIQFQRAFQASARLVTTLNDLTETVIGMLR